MKNIVYTQYNEVDFLTVEDFTLLTYFSYDDDLYIFLIKNNKIEGEQLTYHQNDNDGYDDIYNKEFI